MKLLRRCELIGCQEMGKWWVSECNKGKGICIIYYPHQFFLFSFLRKLGGQNFVSPKGLFFILFSFLFVFSYEPNKIKLHFLPYFSLLLFHSPYFHPNQMALMTKFTFLMVRTKDFFNNLSFPSTLFNFFLHKLNTEANPFLHCC